MLNREDPWLGCVVYCGVLRCVAMCCSAVQYGAVCCSKFRIQKSQEQGRSEKGKKALWQSYLFTHALLRTWSVLVSFAKETWSLYEDTVLSQIETLLTKKHTYMHIYSHIYIYIHIYMYVYVQIYIYTYIYIYIYICICICIFMCV